MPTTSTIKMTARQFLQLGEDPVGVRLELTDGEIAVTPSPVPYHSYTVLKLARILDEHVEARDSGAVLLDVDVVLGEHEVRRPDILFFVKDRVGLIGDLAIEHPPDLCVEVVSPSTARIDREDEHQLYRRAGVRHYWIVDPSERTFEGFELAGESYEPSGRASGEESIALPPFVDLTIPLAKLWRPG